MNREGLKMRVWRSIGKSMDPDGHARWKRRKTRMRKMKQNSHC